MDAPYTGVSLGSTREIHGVSPSGMSPGACEDGCGAGFTLTSEDCAMTSGGVLVKCERCPGRSQITGGVQVGAVGWA